MIVYCWISVLDFSSQKMSKNNGKFATNFSQRVTIVFNLSETFQKEFHLKKKTRSFIHLRELDTGERILRKQRLVPLPEAYSSRGEGEGKSASHGHLQRRDSR